ncbi:MAG TPA: hypothetical protein VH142_14605 [Polyangiaceae bacterium]|jgi:hypothetical protein|nr:hypothetical protein [Polyangiaceae bacterium]
MRSGARALFAVLVASSACNAILGNDPGHFEPANEGSSSGGRTHDAGADSSSNTTGGAGGSSGAPGMGGATGVDSGTGVPDASSSPATTRVGQACTPRGAPGCDGPASVRQILCGSGGKWVDNGACTGTNRCDSETGANQGTCQPIVAVCADHAPGDDVCIGTDVEACGVDLITSEVVKQCAQPTPDCANGACACSGILCGTACRHVDSDPANCGTCAHDCNGGTCASGQCLPVPLATGQFDPGGITVDGTNVYWSNNGDFGGAHGSVQEIAIGGGPIIAIASNEAGPLGIALTDTDVYFVDEGTSAGNYDDGAIRHVPKAGGTVATLAGKQSFPVAIAVTATTAYWTTLDNVLQVKLTGGTPAVITSGTPDQLVVDSKNLYIGGADGTVSLFPLTGGAVKTLATAAAGVLRLAVSATDAYFTTADQVVLSTPIPAGGTIATVASTQNSPLAVAVDDEFVYWTTQGTSNRNFNDGTIVKAPVGGGPTVVLATAQVDPNSITVDATSVYWTNKGSGNGTDGAVMMLAK